MFNKETDPQPPLQELVIAAHEFAVPRIRCHYALESAFESSQVSEIFSYFITSASAQLPEYILFRREGPKGLIRLKGNDKPSPKETCYFFLPKSFETYIFNQEGYRPTSRIYLPGDDNFVGIRGTRRKDLPFHPFFDQATGRGNFNQIKEITAAIKAKTESQLTLDKKLDFRLKELSLRIQACQEAQDEILYDYGGKIKELIPNLRDAILRSRNRVRLPSVINHIKNSHDPNDTSEYRFMVWDVRLLSIPKDTRRGRFFKHSSRVVDSPLTCWYGASEGIKDGLLAALPPSWTTALKSRY